MKIPGFICDVCGKQFAETDSRSNVVLHIPMIANNPLDKYKEFRTRDRDGELWFIDVCHGCREALANGISSIIDKRKADGVDQ
jgi:hypothetical protein